MNFKYISRFSVIALLICYQGLFAQQKKEVDEEKIELYREIGISSYFNMDFQNSVRKFNYIVSKDRADAEVYFYRGLSKANMGSYLTAVKDFERAIELDSLNFDYHYKKGEAYYRMGKWEKAIYAFNDALQIEEDSDLAYYHRAACHKELGNVHGACDDLIKASGLGLDQAKKMSKKYCKGHQSLDEDEE